MSSSHLMNNNTPVVIDFRTNRIRIHKSTLRTLGNPSYISILINPTDNQFIIMPSIEEDYLAHKINWSYLDESKRSYQLYSKTLVTNICKLNPSFKDNLYRYDGTHCFTLPKKGLLFLLNDGKCITRKEAYNG